MNFDKYGVKNYISGNTLMEMGVAHVLNQKIYLYNSTPRHTILQVRDRSSETRYYQWWFIADKIIVNTGQ